MRNLVIFLLLAIGATLTACDAFRDQSPDTFSLGYSDFASLPDYGWRYNDSVVFVTPAASGDLKVAIRHSLKYPYRNIWLEVARVSPDSIATTRRDTVELELADPFGLWKGTGVGPTRQMEAVVESNVSVDSGSRIILRHIMRLDTVPAIEQAGVFIIK